MGLKQGATKDSAGHSRFAIGPMLRILKIHQHAMLVWKGQACYACHCFPSALRPARVKASETIMFDKNVGFTGGKALTFCSITA